MAYRDKSRAKKVLAEGILKGYYELFQTYPDAYRRSDDDLKAFFTTKTTAGVQAVAKTVTTFKALCELADFEWVSYNNIEVLPHRLKEFRNEVEIPTNIVKGMGTGVTININIQLTLPDTTDENVYNKLFEAMKKHLLS